MLFQPDRHEPLDPFPWNESIARDCIEHIVRDTEQRFSPDSYWPWHPKDMEPGDSAAQPALPLYFGAAGVVWALRYLRNVGATNQPNRIEVDLDSLMIANRAWLSSMASDETASYLLGDTSIQLMAVDADSSQARMEQLAALIERNSPSRKRPRP